MPRHRLALATVVATVALALSACGSNAAPPAEETGEAASALAGDPGALVQVTMTSQVGVTLDELPAAERNRVATQLLAKPASFWRARAQMQAEHTNYRLIYRDFFYGASRRMMPITQPDQWNITVAGKARRTTVQGHDVVLVDYSLATTILTDEASPERAEPQLNKVGGVWNEPYSLPLDPEFLLQRTGFACIDEDGFPLGTADSENARQLFDDTCAVENPAHPSCHLTPPYASESCKDALTNHVGRVDTALRFERLKWNASLANQVRTLPPTTLGGADLVPRQDGLADNRIVYKYIAPDSCAIQEGCVKGSGWRRLLEFTASVQNRGDKPLAVGPTADGSPMREHNVFEFSACHQHFHFSHYGDFDYGSFPGEKRAFCVESTARWANNETSPLTHEFSCANQGIQTGWGDDYMAGIDCQWIDITEQKTATTQTLSFGFNPDAFLCEGTPKLDANGQQVFEPTSFTTETGAPVDRPGCNFAAGATSNNRIPAPVAVPAKGGFVTAACPRDLSGPLRNCDFQETQLRTCTPGAKVTLTCTSSSSAPPQVVRVCEASAKLGGTACVYEEALATGTGRSSTVSFTCPSARDATEPGGKYALYTAPVVGGDARTTVTCN